MSPSDICGVRPDFAKMDKQEYLSLSRKEFMFEKLLQLKPILRLRRNHALEHATLNTLSENGLHGMLAGYSDPDGFWIVGSVKLGDLQQAVDKALARLRGGEAALAISPHCGTNFAVAGIFAGGLAWLAMLGAGNSWRRRFEQFPLVIIFSMLGLMVARPLGPLLQAHVTTLASPGKMQVLGIDVHQRGAITIHRILIRHL